MPVVLQLMQEHVPHVRFAIVRNQVKGKIDTGLRHPAITGISKRQCCKWEGFVNVKLRLSSFGIICAPWDSEEGEPIFLKRGSEARTENSRSSMTRMPAIHIPKRRLPTAEAVFLSTERAKSFIQSPTAAGFWSIACRAVFSPGEAAEYPRFFSQEKISGKPMRGRGRKGTAKSPSNRNHR